MFDARSYWSEAGDEEKRKKNLKDLGKRDYYYFFSDLQVEGAAPPQTDVISRKYRKWNPLINNNFVVIYIYITIKNTLNSRYGK